MDYLLNRRSVREFDLDKKLSYETLVELCKYGEAAPSARNQRSREYIVIDDKNILDELSNTSKGSGVLRNCNTAIAVIGKSSEGLATLEMQPADLAASVENILLAATKMNICSCWIGIHPNEERISITNKVLNVKNGKFVYALIALGYPKSDDVFFDKEKFNLSDVYHNKE